MKKMTIIGFLWVVILSCSTKTIAPETGSIDVKVTIGPLCPVEPCNKTASELKAIYESYSFAISNPTTKVVVLEQKLSYNVTNGVFKSHNIVVGDYELNLKPESFFTKRGFPKTIKIEKDKTTSLEIDIDTGIR